MTPHRADHKVLIVASDPFLAALVGSLVEATRLQAAFPDRSERPEDALARIRPLAAVLMDVLADGAASDLFLVKARRRDVPVLLFGSVNSIAQRRAWAESFSVEIYALPAEMEAFRVAIERLA